MKTLWSEIALIDRFLDKQLNKDQLDAVELRLQQDSRFRKNVLAQKHVRTLVRKHYLIRMRQQTKALHQQLYNDPARRALRLAIEALFNL